MNSYKKTFGGLAAKLLARAVGIAALSVAGCAAQVKQDVAEETAVVRKGPEALPQRNITDFDESLRCMDNMYTVFGIGDVIVMMEDLQDNTDSVKAGTRDMVISAISDMTRRSHAIQVIAFGRDTGNLVSFAEYAGQRGVYERVPPFDIRGSITQMDKDIVRKQQDIGASASGVINKESVGGGIGASASASSSILGMDLSIITTHNMAVLPGVTASNTVAISKSGDAIDADMSISKVGVNYSLVNTTSEGTAQALRALVQLSVVELFGKLLKVPYWNCLGIDSKHQDIVNEVGDWYYSMVNTGVLVQYIKTQLYIRDYYNGPIDNEIDEALGDAIAAFNRRLGRQADRDIDLEFFSSFLASTPTSVSATRLAYLKKGDTGGRTESKSQPRSNDAINVSIARAGGKGAFSPGDEISLEVKSDTDGFLYCYYTDAEANTVRFFPNRFTRGDGFIAKGATLVMPGSDPFEMTADANGRAEKVDCFLTTREVFAELPAAMRKADFDLIGVNSTEGLKSAFNGASGGRFGNAVFEVRSR